MSARHHSPAGRPPKFDESRRPVTITLPERTLACLAAVHPDRATAIVKLVEDALPEATNWGRKLVEVVRVARGAAVILVAPSSSLRRIPWLRLAEISPRRHLLTLTPGTPIESLEVAILDLIESLPANESYERTILTALRKLISKSRRSRNISKFEMLYVNPSNRDRQSPSHVLPMASPLVLRPSGRRVPRGLL
jgi:hypothetical protein